MVIAGSLLTPAPQVSSTGARELQSSSAASPSLQRVGSDCSMLLAFDIKGMTCASCSGRIETIVSGMSGVLCIEVNLLMETAAVKIDTTAGLSAVDIETRINHLGFRCSQTGVASRTRGSATAVLSVQGMTCASCTGRIESHLASFPGVETADVQLLIEKAVIKYNPAVLSVADLVSEVNGLGFSAKDLSSEAKSQSTSMIVISGTSCCGKPIGPGLPNCPFCLDSIVAALQEQQGALMVTMDAVAATMSMTLDPQQTSVRTLARMVSNMSPRFQAQPESNSKKADAEDVDGDEESAEQSEQSRWMKLFVISMVFTLPVFAIAMVLPQFDGAKKILMKPTFFTADTVVSDHAQMASKTSLMDMDDMAGMPPLNVGELLCWALTTPVQFIVGAPFYKRAYGALKHGSANMDVLVTLGTSVAYFYSVYIVLGRTAEISTGMHFFETSAMLITFLTLGRTLEARAKSKTTTAITALLELKPSEAILLTIDEASGRVVEEETIPAEDLEPGDIVKVVPGSKMPADGVVVDGSSNVDEAMITGESVPVHKETGMEVIGGTVNGHGSLRVRVSQVGNDTMLSRIIRLVEDAQTNKAPVQRFADKISAIFVPIILVIAAVTFAFWYIMVIADVVR